jgi:hypothetical protein
MQSWIWNVEHEPEKWEPVLLGINAKRLPGDHAQQKITLEPYSTQLNQALESRTRAPSQHDSLRQKQDKADVKAESGPAIGQV